MHTEDPWLAKGGSYEYRLISMPPYFSHGEARRIVADQAEYGRWELARSAIYWGGQKRVWLRRKVLRVESTL
ncbi:MAG: DUF5703 family protein [Bifidobacteriaceae bacterium]|nr:DUF5703 family protein [Bifidobacteriaceae bacterium]